MSIYTETSLYLGEQKQCTEFADWAEVNARLQAGWMQVTLLELLPLQPLTDSPYHRTPHLIQELHEAGLTHAVLLVQLVCDDETDSFQQAALRLGLRQTVLYQENQAKFHPEWGVEEGRESALRGDSHLILRQYPFRMSAWNPIRTAHGEGEADQTDREWVQSIYEKPRGKRVSPAFPAR